MDAKDKYIKQLEDLGKQRNTGQFNKDRLIQMIEVCRRWGKLSKEHNGDYLTNDQMKERFDKVVSLRVAKDYVDMIQEDMRRRGIIK